jgi:hypothetical protein
MKTKAFPNTQFSGFDTHDRLIAAARRIVREAGISRSSKRGFMSASAYPNQRN